MKKLTVCATLFVAMVITVSCGKDKDSPSGSTLAKIQAKWSLTSVSFQFGDLGDSTYNGVAADYFDFRTDGNVYTSVNGEQDTSTYSVLNDSKMLISSDTVDIKQLTSSQFVFEGDTLIAPIILKTIVSLHK